MEKLTDLREALSNLEHEQWMHWSQTVGERINFWKRTLSEENKKINVVKLDEIEFRMHAQLDGWEPNWVPYIELPEDVKDFDREWADKVIVLFASFLETKRKELRLAYADSMFETGEIKGFADALYTQHLISKPKYAAVLETVLNLTKKMRTMLAVFGGEEKKKGDDEK